MTTAAFALIAVREPEHSEPHEIQAAWRAFCNALRTEASNSKDVQSLGEGAALLILPDGLPSLGPLLASVRHKKIHYTVQFFDSPLLSYSNQDAQKQDQ